MIKKIFTIVVTAIMLLGVAFGISNFYVQAKTTIGPWETLYVYNVGTEENPDLLYFCNADPKDCREVIVTPPTP